MCGVVHHPASTHRRGSDGRTNLADPPQSANGLVHVISPPASQPCHRAVGPCLPHCADLRRRDRRPPRWHPPHKPAPHARRPRPLSVGRRRWPQRSNGRSTDGLCTEATLCRVAERLNTPGRPWVRRFLRVLAGRAPGRARESDWERPRLRRTRQRGVVPTREPGQGDDCRGMATCGSTLRSRLSSGSRGRRAPGAPHGRGPRPATTVAIDVADAVDWAVERVGEAELTTDFDATLDEIVASIELRRQEVAASLQLDSGHCDEQFRTHREPIAHRSRAVELTIVGGRTVRGRAARPCTRSRRRSR